MASDMMNVGYFLARWFSRANVKGAIKITVTFETERDFHAARESTLREQYDAALECTSRNPRHHIGGFPSSIHGIAFQFRHAERRCGCGYCASCTHL